MGDSSGGGDISDLQKDITPEDSPGGNLGIIILGGVIFAVVVVGGIVLYFYTKKDEDGKDKDGKDKKGGVEIPSSIIIAGVIFIILIIIFFYSLLGGGLPFIISGITGANPSTVQFSPISQWGSPEDISGSTCTGYKFGVKKLETTGGVDLISLGVPSLTRLNSCDDIGGCPEDITIRDTFFCTDEDQINAIRQSHTCDRTVIDGENVYDYPTSSVLCTKMNGEQADYGDTEFFYTYCKKKFCAGQVGSISVGFSRSQDCDGNNFYCLQRDINDNDKLSAGKCNLSNMTSNGLSTNFDQQFRIILDDSSSQITTSSELGEGLSGNKMRIEQRGSCDQNGDGCRCVYPKNRKGPNDNGLIMDDCKREADNLFNGFVWAIIPPTTYPESVFCKDTYTTQGDVDTCLKKVNNDAYQTCFLDCQNDCTNQFNNSCVPGCPKVDEKDNVPHDCIVFPLGDADKDYDACIGKNEFSGSCQGVCVADICTNKKNCYAVCQNIIDIDGNTNTFSGNSSQAQQQIIYIGNGKDYTKKIPTKDKSDLYDYIVDTNSISIFQTNNGDFVMKKYSIGMKKSFTGENKKPTCGDAFSKCASNSSCADYLTSNYSGIIVGFALYNTLSNLSDVNNCECDNVKNGDCKNCEFN